MTATLARLYRHLRAWLTTEPCCRFASDTDEGCDPC